MTGHTNTTQDGNKYVASVVLVTAVAVAVTVALAVYVGLFSNGSAAEPAHSTIAVSSDRLDFGEIPLHGTVVRQLVLRNDGDEPVRAQITVNGRVFSVDPAQLVLHPGISSRISIEARADELGALAEELRIELEDSAPLVIALDGQGTDGSEQVGPPSRRDAPMHAAAESRSEEPLETEVVLRPTAPPRSTQAPVVTADASRVAATNRTTNPVPRRRRPRQPRAPRRHASPRAAPRPIAARTATRAPATIPIAPWARESCPTTRRPRLRSAVSARGPARRPPGISEADAANAAELPSSLPDVDEDGVPDVPADIDPGDDDDLFDDDPFDNDDSNNDIEEDDDPFDVPALKISGMSTVRLLGSTAPFYPQEIAVLGGGAGAFGLAQFLLFPQLPLAFGESMVFAQTASAQAGFDPMSGQVTLNLPLQAVDSDGDAAPITVHLTTGTAVARNAAGLVVSLTGTPRASNGVVRLVAIEKIPTGFRNGAEESLVIFEIIASLNFANTNNDATRPDSTFGRIGG